MLVTMMALVLERPTPIEPPLAKYPLYAEIDDIMKQKSDILKQL
jgi:hypothetical protein